MDSNSVWRRLLLVCVVALAMPARAQDPAPLDAEALAALGIEQEIPTAPTAAAPPKVQPNDGSWDWSTGPYSYDGAGNIIGIGTQSFTYDVRGRLVGATMTRSDQPGSQQFTYSYDVMGNMVSRTAVTSTAIPTPTSASTNHLTANGAAYDAAGNLTTIQPPGQPFTYAHTYDALNALQKTHVTSAPNTPRYYVYTADDERLWTHDGVTNSNRWTLRDLSGKVLRDFTFDWVGDQPRWRLSRDYVYRDGLLLAAITPTETLHFSLDHLGSVRVVTDANKQRVGLHYYLPFGEEWLVDPQATDTEPMKFTGHERDSDVAGGTAALDYMHARYYTGRVGRFLSIDPKLDRKRTMAQPQLWNRYAYALNNPLVYTDPTGTTVYVITYTVGNDYGDEEFRRSAMTRAALIRGMKSFDPKKDTVIVRGVLNRADFAKTLAEARSLEAKYGKVGELSMFSHAGPEDGPTFHHNVPPLEQFSKSDLQSMDINWEWWGYAKFYGCNTGKGFTQRFANAQGVTAYGFESFAGFSGSSISWLPPSPNGPMYMVQTNSNFTTGGFEGALRRYLGIDTSIAPMEPADPEEP